MDEILANAAQLANAGFYVARAWGARHALGCDGLICECNGGAGACRVDQPAAHPLHSNFSRTATLDPATLMDWRAAHPTENFVALTGAQSGLVGIGFDTRNALMRALERYGRLPFSPTSQAPDGVVTTWLHWRQPIATTRNLLGPNLRLHAENDWLPVPGSRVPGGHHRWLIGPDAAPFGRLPVRWRESIRTAHAGAPRCRIFASPTRLTGAEEPAYVAQ